jgi:hypothetical protein
MHPAGSYVVAKEDPMNRTLLSSRSAVCSTLALVLCLTGLKGAPEEGAGQEGPGIRAEIREGVGRIFWFGEFANSDAWRDVQAALWSDTAYLELMQQAEGRFVEGSWRESLEMLTQS